MFVERLLMSDVISFLAPAIQSGSETGCLYVRVGEGGLIFISGGQFVIKKAILKKAAEDQKNKKPLPETFMIPEADLLAFKKMMDEHKSECKKLPETDPNFLFVEVSNIALTSNGSSVFYEQPKHEFKDLETHFQITKEHISEIPIMSADVIDVMKGFQKSDSIKLTFTGNDNPIHFQQEEHGLEAILVPPVEAVQTTIDDHE